MTETYRGRPVRRHRAGAALALVVLLGTGIVSCGDDGEDAPSGAPDGGGEGGASTTNQIDIEGFAFKPEETTVKVGTTVTWTQRDGSVHTVTADDNSFDSSDLTEVGQQFTHTFDTAGTVPYKCTIHSSMTGTVIVQ